MKLTYFRELIKSNVSLLIVIGAAFCFFIFASSFNYLSHDSDFHKWLSPDETANYTVAKLYAETGNFQFFEKYNLIASDIIHPRSFRSDWGWIKPMSFIGLPFIYGSIARVLGTATLSYLTPFYGALGVIFFYLLIKELFNKQTALFSALLLSVFPIYIYFSARSFFHNILFIVMLIIGSYFSVIMTKNRSEKIGSYFKKNRLNLLSAFLAGLFFGLAIITRTSELIWVGPLLLGLYIFNFRKVGIIKLFILVCGILIALMPAFYWNQVMYGHWYSSGYPELNSSLGTLTENGATLAQTTFAGHFLDIKPVLAKIKMTIFHFGYKPRQSLNMFDKYVYNMFPWLFWGTLTGIILFFARFKNYSKGRWLFFLTWVGLSIILVLYYGSWLFFDNPDPKSFTIGNSYTRYWLPLYLGAIVFTSIGVTIISGWLRRPTYILMLRAIVFAVIATISIRFVWLDPAEGLAVSIAKQAQAKEEWKQILNLTEKNSVIITRYHDKVLFPERKVIIGLFNDKNMITEYSKLVKRLPVYYYNFSLPEKDINYLNNGALREAGVELILVKQVTNIFTLYHLRPVPIGPRLISAT